MKEYAEEKRNERKGEEEKEGEKHASVSQEKLKRFAETVNDENIRRKRES